MGSALKGDSPDPAPKAEAPPEEVDTQGQSSYRKQRLKARKGRQSTVLTGLGSQNQQKKTVLG